jgi:hypothetical protein
MGCPGLEPGTRRMKVDEFNLIFLNKNKNTSSQTVLAIFIAHGFLYVVILFDNFMSNFLIIIKLTILLSS